MQILGNKILVKPEKYKEKTDSGIYLPDAILGDKLCGEVILVGKKDMQVKVGQKVYYDTYSGHPFEYKGEDMLIMSQYECFCADDKPISNYVKIKMERKADEYIMKDGKKLFIDPTYQVGKHASVVGTVIGVPDKLRFVWNKSIFAEEGSMEWETDMELEVGDTVWYSFVALSNSLGRLMDEGAKHNNKKYIVEGGEVYVFIPYDQIFVAKRKDKVICLNGYLLIEPIFDEKIESKLLELPNSMQPSKSKKYGKVAYMGSCCRNHLGYSVVDADGFDVGDTVVFDRFWNLPLEYDIHRSFDGNKEFYRVQRRGVNAIIKL